MKIWKLLNIILLRGYFKKKQKGRKETRGIRKAKQEATETKK
jgi:hypothetical protein